MKKFSGKTIVALAMMLILFGGSALGAYKLIMAGGLTGQVTSQAGGVLMTEMDWEDIPPLDATNSSVTFDTYARIKNNNGQFSNMTILFDVEKALLDPSCPDYEDDCSFSYDWNGVEVFNGSLVNVNTGYNYLNLTMNCRLQSCPASMNATWSIE